MSDSRDVIFQADPFERAEFEKLQVFEESRRMTLGSCPYNSDWLRKWFPAPARGVCQQANYLCGYHVWAYGPNT